MVLLPALLTVLLPSSLLPALLMVLLVLLPALLTVLLPALVMVLLPSSLMVLLPALLMVLLPSSLMVLLPALLTVLLPALLTVLTLLLESLVSVCFFVFAESFGSYVADAQLLAFPVLEQRVPVAVAFSGAQLLRVKVPGQQPCRSASQVRPTKGSVVVESLVSATGSITAGQL